MQNLPGVSLPPNYNELPKQGGKIRSPYRERAYAYMAICRVLALKFNEAADKVHDYFMPLEECVFFAAVVNVDV